MATHLMAMDIEGIDVGIQVVEAIGDDNIVMSTDYPHSDSLFPEAMNEFVALEGVSDKTKAKILWDNCARLYPLAAGR